MHSVSVGGHRIEYVRLPSAHPRPEAPTLVFLHEGLGSVAMWRDFPQQLADATGCEALVYSRYGYGRSSPISAPRAVDYMHVEAEQALPELLAKLAIGRPILFGHSDGGSIALLHAGRFPDAVRAVIVMAPHVLVEAVSVESIAAAKIAWRDTDLRQRLARYHADVDSAFCGWNDIWLHPDFRSWNIESCLPAIRCPLLAIQGEDDEYGTLEQIRRIAAGAADVEQLILADCRHSPHKDQPQAVIAGVSTFISRLLD